MLLQGNIAIRIKSGKRISAHSFNRSELLIVTRQLATMLKAGLSIVDSLHLVADEHPQPHWQYLLVEIERQISTGEPLSQVLLQHQTIFPMLYCEIIATGELTGLLDESFEQLAIQLEKSIQLYKRIKKALRYPVFLLSVSIIVMLVMLLFVLPKFSDIYRDFDAQLPIFTQYLMDFSDYLQRNWLILLVISLLGYLIYQRYLKLRYRAKIDYWLIKLPLFGKIIQTNCLAQIFQTLSITQQAGIPLLTGLIAAANTAYNSHYQTKINQMISKIEHGHSFSYVLNRQIFFPALCSQLIRSGEESGTLDLMLSRLANYYQEKNQGLTDNLSQAFEPILMLILTLIIGGLILAMYLPILQLGDVIH
ncbi:hypothetical protein A9G12_09205 [Gilliamella sp. wkB112]|nr:hypothetical protein A9G12_09205 [Gilliamella apicola]